MKRMKIIIVVAIVSAIQFSMAAQAVWTSAGINASPMKKLGVAAEIGYRSADKLETTNRYSVGFSADYRFGIFKIDGGYKFIRQQSEEESTKKGNLIPAFWTTRHLGFASLSAKYRIGQFEFSVRERYQLTHRNGKWVPKFASDGVTAKDDEWISDRNKHILRSRLGGSYRIRNSRFSPFMNIEFYDNLAACFSLDKVRVTAGTELKINKKNKLEIFYRYIHTNKTDNDGNIGNRNVIGVGYTFKIK